MIIEQGDFFLVARGRELPEFSIRKLLGISMPESVIPESEKPNYDRGLEGVVFEALAVCGDHIAAKVVYRNDRGPHVGTVIPLANVGIELTTVTPAFVNALNSSAPEVQLKPIAMISTGLVPYGPSPLYGYLKK